MSKFRDTLWFKKGVTNPGQPGAPDADPAGADLPDAPAADSLRPLEDRYNDDGSLTAADIEEHSLRTPAIIPPTPPAKR